MSTAMIIDRSDEEVSVKMGMNSLLNIFLWIVYGSCSNGNWTFLHTYSICEQVGLLDGFGDSIDTNSFCMKEGTAIGKIYLSFFTNFAPFFTLWISSSREFPVKGIELNNIL